MNAKTIVATAATAFAVATFATAASAQVPCAGVNACKGMNDCHTATNACKGQASCKGTGWVSLPASTCTNIGGKAG